MSMQMRLEPGYLLTTLKDLTNCIHKSNQGIREARPELLQPGPSLREDANKNKCLKQVVKLQ